MRQPARLILAASLAALLTAAVAPLLAQRGPTLDREGTTALTAQLRSAVERGDVPAAVGLVVGPRGVLFEGAFGTLDAAARTPLPADAVFNIASMTKPVTSVAVMMFVDQGRVALDDPISKHLPGFDAPVVFTGWNADGTPATRPAKGPVTIRHLLANTSGIGYAFSNAEVAQLQERTMRSETEIPLVHDPGARWTYGASTRVLGQLVEKLSGEPLDVFFARRIFEPLGMTDTSYRVPEGKQARLIGASRRENGRFVQQAPQAGPPAGAPVRGDGGLYSTARDYSRFIQMFLNGGQLNGTRILSERAVRQMGENHTGTVAVSEQPAVNAALTRPFPIGAGQDRFGLGFQIAARDDRYAAYRKPGSLSWAGIFNTHFWIDPQARVGGVVMMQLLPFYDEAAMRTLRDFERTVYQHLD